MKLYDQVKRYKPFNKQETKDKKVMLNFINNYNDILIRKNKIAHFSASGWILNKEKTKVLMIYHNIYDSWAWTGGHADGEENLLKVALLEAEEETGLKNVKPIKTDIFSLEIITVKGHVKRGKYVSSHLHMNLTYLLEADENRELVVKPDENSGVRWFDINEVVDSSSEPWMRLIYNKLNKKCINYGLI